MVVKAFCLGGFLRMWVCVCVYLLLKAFPVYSEDSVWSVCLFPLPLSLLPLLGVEAGPGRLFAAL